MGANTFSQICGRVNKQKKKMYSAMSLQQTGTALQMVIDGITEMEKQMSILIFEGSKVFSAEVFKQFYVCNKANIYTSQTYLRFR